MILPPLIVPTAYPAQKEFLARHPERSRFSGVSEEPALSGSAKGSPLIQALGEIPALAEPRRVSGRRS
jgi:hypothetical protein